MDDADVGARYARDAMRATARARSRRDEETLDAGPRAPRRDGRRGRAATSARSPTRTSDGDEAETSGKPLGWLFRSSS